jgi:DNA-binding response OmpR family regulator
MEKTRTVLVIEDEASVQALLYEVLSDAGYRVLQAYDGVQGLDLAMSDRPHLIILDFGLPVQPAMDILVRLKDGRDTRRIPVIALTDQPASLGDGPLPLDAWLPKPFDIDALLVQVNRLADPPLAFEQQPLTARPAQAGTRAEKG